MGQRASQGETSDDKIVKQNAHTEMEARNEIIENQNVSTQRYPRRERQVDSDIKKENKT